MRKLYDGGYWADGHLDSASAALPTTKVAHETSTEHDSHNDSGYSTRLCSASQGPSPALQHYATRDGMLITLANNFLI